MTVRRLLVAIAMILTMSVAAAPTQAVTGPAKVILATTGTNQVLYVLTPGATSWRNLGGQLATAPVLVNDRTSTHVIAMGTNQTLYHRTLTTGWTRLAPTGFQCTHLGGAISPDLTTITIGCRGVDSALYALSFPSADPAPFTDQISNLGGAVRGAPGVAYVRAPLVGGLQAGVTFLTRGAPYTLIDGSTANTYARTLTEDWVPADTVLGKCATGPALATRGTTVFAACQGDTRILVYWRGATTSGRYTSDGALDGTAAIAIPGNGSATLAIRGGNKVIYQRPLPKSTVDVNGGWVNLEGLSSLGMGATAVPPTP